MAGVFEGMNEKERKAYEEAQRVIDLCRQYADRRTELDLQAFGLTALPPEIGQLTSLRKLYLQDNQLTALPPEIGQLERLDRLWLQRNRLLTLPAEVGHLKALTDLRIDFNELASLPSEMGRLASLVSLTLHHNPNLGIPVSVLGRDIYSATDSRPLGRPLDILNYYFAQREAAAAGTLQRLNEIKVMLVGDGGVGKTSLRRFFRGEAHVDGEPETRGIVLSEFPLTCGGHNITVRLWDFAGQEITHALHEFFLTEGCAYLVIVEPRSDNEEGDAERWLKLIARYGKGAPALVVMNKQDTRHPGGYDIDRNLLMERFPFIREFERTSCGRVREGCEELRSKLCAVLTVMAEADLEVPESWLRVKDECFAKGRDGQERKYLSLEEFRALCARHGEQDREKQESLARILHNLGAVLHFVDEPRLRDTTVLNPHWVTDGAYRLLRAKDAPGSGGTLTLAEAMAAVPGADEKATRYLLGLMERFEMCFTVEETEEGAPSPQRWLVPGALDKNQPAEVKAAEWKEPSAVRLRYMYDPLPQGVLPRFIVMTHLLSEKLPRWRNGVVLHDRAARALIRKGQKENTVEVTVQGPDAEREKLAKTVRGYLARIHADLPEPKPKALQALAGTDDFREVQQMEEAEQAGVPLVSKTREGLVKKSATAELNRTSAEPPRKGNKRPLRVFLSHASEDKRARGLFEKNLIVLENDGYITFWADPNIKVGMEWRPEIDRELETMDVFIGLLTTPFLASNFIQRVEFQRAMERRAAKSAEMWLVLVDPRPIEGTKFAGIQVLQPEGRAVRDHRHGLRGGFDAAEAILRTRIQELWAAQPDREAGPRQFE